MYLFQKIEEVSLQYNDARMNIAEFLLEKRYQSKHYGMQQIAEITYTSKATLVRFAKNLGYHGWRDFFQAFLEEAGYMESHPSEIDPNFPFGKEDHTGEIIQKLSQLHVQSIRETTDLLNEQTVEAAADLILSAKHVVVFGLSPNTLLGALFKRQMETIGILVLVADSDAGTISRSLTEEDCAVLISYSGNNENRAPMRYVPVMEKHHVKMIGITSQGKNYLSGHVSCCLAISSKERLYSKIGSFSSQESIRLILNILYACCFAKDYERNFRYKQQNSRELEYERSAVLKEMREDYDEHVMEPADARQP